jgi:hypothetical protein
MASFLEFLNSPLCTVEQYPVAYVRAIRSKHVDPSRKIREREYEALIQAVKSCHLAQEILLHTKHPMTKRILTHIPPTADQNERLDPHGNDPIRVILIGADRDQIYLAVTDTNFRLEFDSLFSGHASTFNIASLHANCALSEINVEKLRCLQPQLRRLAVPLNLSLDPLKPFKWFHLSESLEDCEGLEQVVVVHLAQSKAFEQSWVTTELRARFHFLYLAWTECKEDGEEPVHNVDQLAKDFWEEHALRGGQDVWDLAVKQTRESEDMLASSSR